jgi:hypothetical protein
MIEFWITPAKRLIPLEVLAGGLRQSHWATCPFANEFRREGDSFTAAQPVQRRLF